MKKLLCSLLALMMCFTSVSPVYLEAQSEKIVTKASSLPFSDVKENAWYYNSVKEAYELGLMKADGGKDLFNPNGSLTRGMVATILYRMDGTNEKVTFTNKFNDVKEGIWFSNAIIWANNHQIVSGYKNGNFGPDDKITREDLCIMLYNYAKYKNLDTSKTADLSKYEDYKAITSYAKTAVSWALANGIIGGSSKLNPTGYATRAEASKMVVLTYKVKVAVDKKALNDKIDEAKKLDTANYTDSSIKALNEAISNAEKVNNDRKASQKDVDEALNLLTEAINNLTYKAGDYRQVDEAISNANKLDKDLYQDFSKVEEAIKAVIKDLDITKQQEIDDMAKAINDTIKALVYKQADYDSVNEEISRANALDKTLYQNYEVVEKAIAEVIENLDITKQEEVDMMAQAIRDAINALVYKQADYSKVDEAIKAANELNPDLYVDFSEVEAAIDDVVRDYDITNQTSVDNMAKAINDAINALVYKDADYDEVDAAIAQASQLEEEKDLYKNFDQVEQAIAAVVRDYDITKQEEVDAMAKAINDAINALEYKDADYSRVDAAISTATSLNKDLYKNYEVLQAAIDAVIRGYNITQQIEVNDMADAIVAAIDELEYKDADYSKVDAAKMEADGLDKLLYVSFDAVEEAINSVIEGLNITEQERVDEMAKAIKDAINALVYKDADYSKVDEAINAANDLDKDLYQDFSKVEEAIAAVVRGYNITKQNDVDKMAKAIKDAINALVYKDADYSKVDEAIVLGQAKLDEYASEKEYYKGYKALQEAINNVVRGYNITKQAEVDAMASAITEASNKVQKAQMRPTAFYDYLEDLPRVTKMVFTDKVKTADIKVFNKLGVHNDEVIGWVEGDTYYISSNEDGVKISASDREEKMFSQCRNVQTIDLTNFDTTNITDMSYMFGNCNDLQTIIFGNFNTSNVENMEGMFISCGSLTSLDLSCFDTANVTNMKYMFDGCEKLESVKLNSFDTSNVTAMNSMFTNCKALTSVDLSSFKVDKVTDMAQMFAFCNALTSLDLSNFNSINVEDMSYLFYECKNLETINLTNFKTNKVTVMHNMFNGCKALKAIDVSSFDTTNCTELSIMFANCTSLEKLDLSSFNTSNVTNLSSMVASCTSLKELNLANLDMSSAFITVEMFNGCSSLTTLNLQNAKLTSKIKDAFTSLTGDNIVIDLYNATVPEDFSLEYFPNFNETWTIKYPADYSKVDEAVAEAYDLNRLLYVSFDAVQDAISSIIEGLNISDQSRVDEMAKAIKDAINALVYKDADYTKVDEAIALGQAKLAECEAEKELYKGYNELQEAINAVVRGYNITKQSEVDAMASAITEAISEVQKAELKSIQFYTILKNNSSITKVVVTDEVFSDQANSYDNLGINNTDTVIGWKNGDTYYISSNEPEVKVSAPQDSSWMFFGLENITDIDLSGLDTKNVTNMSFMFDSCTKLTTLDLSGFDTTNVTSMQNMFYYCTSLTTLDLSGLDTTNVTNMSYMFYYCTSLTTLDLSGFDTTNVTDMSYMFYKCDLLESIDVSEFDTTNVTDMSHMFSACDILDDIDVSEFDTINVTNMSGMFNNCPSLTTLDLSGFNTTNVTNMSHMFASCSSLTTLDLSGFNTTNVTSMLSMFSNCSSLTTLDLSGFDTRNVTDMSYMFSWCMGLTSLNLSGWDTMKLTDMSGMFDASSELKNIDLSNAKLSSTWKEGFNSLTGDNLVIDLTNATVPEDFSLEYFPNFNETWTIKYPADYSKVDKAINVASGLNKNLYKDYSDVETAINSVVRDKYISSQSEVDNMAKAINDAINALVYKDASYRKVDMAIENAQYRLAECEAEKELYKGYDELQEAIDAVVRGYDITRQEEVDAMAKAIEDATNRLCKAKLWYHTLNNVLANINVDRVIFTDEEFTDQAESYDNLGVTEDAVIGWQVADTYFVSSNKKGFKIIVDDFDTAFRQMRLEELDLSNLDVSNVSSMSYTFGVSNIKNINFSGWDTSKVTNMTSMFEYGAFKNINLSNAIISSAWKEGFEGLSGNNINIDLTNATVPEDFSLEYFPNFNETWTIKYPADYTKVDEAISLGQAKLAEYEAEKELYKGYKALEEAINAVVRGYNITKQSEVDAMASAITEAISKVQKAELDNFYFSSTLSNNSSITKIIVTDEKFSDQANSCDNLGTNGTNVVIGWKNDDTYFISSNEPGVKVSALQDSSLMFDELENITEIHLSGLDTRNVTSMTGMFYNCSSLTTLDLSGFDTTNVISMRYMFIGCSSLTTLDLSGFDTTNVIDMAYMFGDCSLLNTLDLSGFDTTNVIDMSYMFYNTEKLTNLNLNGWNTTNVTNMSSMFDGCTSLTSLDLTNTVLTSESKNGFKELYCNNLTIDLTNATVPEDFSLDYFPGHNSTWTIIGLE